MYDLIHDIISENNKKFENPSKILDVFTSDKIPYEKLCEFADILMTEIRSIHLTGEGHRYHCISQVILECYKRIYGFNSNNWISEAKLTYNLKAGQDFIIFNRINAKGENCSYKIVNFDQIDFKGEVPIVEPVRKKKKAKTHSANSSCLDNISAVKHEVKENDIMLLNIIKFLDNGENLFITGYAGTGKSYILKKLKEFYGKKLTITSTTGIAAVNVKGQTLHSWSGVGLCRNTVLNTVEKIKHKKSQYKQILGCKMLAVDEISMLNKETFEYVNNVLKQVRENDLPFGGIQVIFIGDFFQLPPVEKEYSKERQYCFDSKLWKDLNLKNIVLKKNYRQKEEDFINALSHMRTNNINAEDIALLNTRSVNVDTSQTNILHIFSTNEEANYYNYTKFNALDKPVKVFYAIDAVVRGKNLVYNNFTVRENNILDIFNKNCRVEKEIHLKIGCKVMLLINLDFDRGLINGACGTVEKFDDDYVNITFDNGVNTDILPNKFEYYYNDSVLAIRTQYPLKLAYGITIHKSQGMTIDKLVVDCSRIFERGQIYVAMSRVKTLSGLYLKSFNPKKVFTDSRVAEFYDNLEEAEISKEFTDSDKCIKQF